MHNLRRTVFALLIASPAIAQVCTPGDILLKNDILPGAPAGLNTVAVVPGLCDNEAAMAVLDTGPCTVISVSAMFGQAQGTNGVIALCDIELYDGATLQPNGRYVLGPMVYQFSAGGSNAQIQTHAINEVAIPGNVRITSGKLVVGWRMLLNSSVGSCLFGYTSNFCTDFSGQCLPGRNIIDAGSPINGPVDPMTFAFPTLGTPICGTPFWNGDWIIRACVTPDLGITATGNPTPGGAVLLDLLAPGHAGEHYLTMLSLGTQPGFSTPWGQIPLNPDFLFECTLNPSCWGQIMANNSGTLNSNSQATTVLLIPNLPLLQNSGLTMYAAFFTSLSPSWVPFSAVSPPSSPIVIN